MKALLFALAAFVLLHASAIRMEQSGVKHIFRLTNVSGNGDFSVFVDLPDGAAQSPAMLGSTERQGADLVFVPRFPLAPGMRVRAVWKPASGKPITALFNLPKVELAPTTFVQQVFSTSNRLPENQLNVYIHFSAPMSKGESYGIGRAAALRFCSTPAASSEESSRNPK